MDANTYQAEAKRTLIDVPDRDIPLDELQLVWAALQISITAGKLVEHLKKGIFHQHGVDNTFVMESIDAIQELITMQDAPIMPTLTGEQIMKLWVLSGLIGETAEAGETILTELEGGIPIGLQKELGDIQWYLTSLATQYGLSMNDVLIGNVTKLQKRYRNGYSSEASKNRVTD